MDALTEAGAVIQRCHRAFPRWVLSLAGIVGCALAGQGAAQTVQLAASTDVGSGTFSYAMGNLTPATNTITTTGGGVVTTSPVIATVVDPLQQVVITQQDDPDFLYEPTSASCVNTNGGTGGIGSLSGNTLTIPAAALTAGATLVCTFVNEQTPPDLAITKSANVSTVASGGTVIYTLVASNGGANTVNDAVVNDAPGPGQSCTTPATCTPNGGTCPTSLPSGDAFTGVTIPSLPGDSSVIFTIQCTVTATGQ